MKRARGGSETEHVLLRVVDAVVYRGNNMENLLTALAAAYDRVARSAFSESSCVAATRIGIDALARAGVRAYPIPVEAYAMNETAWTLAQPSGQSEPGTPWDTINAEKGKHEPWVVQLGNPENARTQGGVGHVIIGVTSSDGERWCADLTAGQMSRPRKQLIVPTSLVFQANQNFFTTIGSTTTVSLPHAEIEYVRLRERLFELSVNWARRSANPLAAQDFPRFADQIAAIIGRM